MMGICFLLLVLFGKLFVNVDELRSDDLESFGTHQLILRMRQQQIHRYRLYSNVILDQFRMCLMPQHKLLFTFFEKFFSFLKITFFRNSDRFKKLVPSCSDMVDDLELLKLKIQERIDRLHALKADSDQ